MSPDHFLWLSTGSTESPRILTPRLSNSGLRRAMVPSSVVQTGVKSLGWENSTAQPLPIQSWKLSEPWVVSAVKLGASSLMRSDMMASICAVCPAAHRRGVCRNPPPAGPFLTHAGPASKHGATGDAAQAESPRFKAAWHEILACLLQGRYFRAVREPRAEGPPCSDPHRWPANGSHSLRRLFPTSGAALPWRRRGVDTRRAAQR